MRTIVIINLQCSLLKAGGEGGRIMGKTGVKDGGRAGCEKRKILTLPSPYPFLMSDRR